MFAIKLLNPADTSTLIAPVIMGVMRHVKIYYPNREDAVVFIADHVLNPQRSKAVCMAQNIDKFGLMLSQKGAITKDEAKLIATWLFDNYPPKGFRGMHESQQDIMKKIETKGKKISPFLIKKGLTHFTGLIKKN